MKFEPVTDPAPDPTRQMIPHTSVLLSWQAEFFHEVALCALANLPHDANLPELDALTTLKVVTNTKRAYDLFLAQNDTESIRHLQELREVVMTETPLEDFKANQENIHQNASFLTWMSCEARNKDAARRGAGPRPESGALCVEGGKSGEMHACSRVSRKLPKKDVMTLF